MGVCVSNGVYSNTEGSYQCDCDDGFFLNSSNICAGDYRMVILSYSVDNGILLLNADIDECEQSPCGINANCTNAIGSFNCSCEDGFHLNESAISTGFFFVKPSCECLKTDYYYYRR